MMHMKQLLQIISELTLETRPEEESIHHQHQYTGSGNIKNPQFSGKCLEAVPL